MVGGRTERRRHGGRERGAGMCEPRKASERKRLGRTGLTDKRVAEQKRGAKETDDGKKTVYVHLLRAVLQHRMQLLLAQVVRLRRVLRRGRFRAQVRLRRVHLVDDCAHTGESEPGIGASATLVPRGEAGRRACARANARCGAVWCVRGVGPSGRSCVPSCPRV